MKCLSLYLTYALPGNVQLPRNRLVGQGGGAVKAETQPNDLLHPGIKCAYRLIYPQGEERSISRLYQCGFAIVGKKAVGFG